MNSRSILHSDAEITDWLAKQREAGARIVFTNGVFDLIHPGHVECLRRARAMGDVLLVGVNSDESVRRIKGEGRPILPLDQRLRVLAGLEYVNAVAPFHEDTSDHIIELVRPDVLVKGGDYGVEGIVGHQFVQSYGGEVHPMPFVPGYSTTDLIARIKASLPAT